MKLGLIFSILLYNNSVFTEKCNHIIGKQYSAMKLQKLIEFRISLTAPACVSVCLTKKIYSEYYFVNLVYIILHNT